MEFEKTARVNHLHLKTFVLPRLQDTYFQSPRIPDSYHQTRSLTQFMHTQPLMRVSRLPSPTRFDFFGTNDHFNWLQLLGDLCKHYENSVINKKSFPSCYAIV